MAPAVQKIKLSPSRDILSLRDIERLPGDCGPITDSSGAGAWDE